MFLRGQYISGYLNIKKSCGRKSLYSDSSSGLSAGGCTRPTLNRSLNPVQTVVVINVMARGIQPLRLKD